MAEQAKEGTGNEKLQVLADRGYFSGEEILKCEQADILPLVPRPLTSNARAEGRFDKRDFVYNKRRDEYRCPAGQREAADSGEVRCRDGTRGCIAGGRAPLSVPLPRARSQSSERGRSLDHRNCRDQRVDRGH